MTHVLHIQTIILKQIHEIISHCGLTEQNQSVVLLFREIEEERERAKYFSFLFSEFCKKKTYPMALFL